MISRRQFLKTTAALGVGLSVAGQLSTDTPLASAASEGLRVAPRPTAPQPVSRNANDSTSSFIYSQGLRKFAQPLRSVDAIPVALPDAQPAPVTGALHYTIAIAQYHDRLHPDLPPTTLRGYNPVKALGFTGRPPQRHLGGIIIAQQGTPIQITFRNQLGRLKHPLPIDTSLMGADEGENRVVTHLHGGHVPWISDGGPFGWWDPDGRHGESFLNNRVLNPHAAGNEAEFYYPNDQSARLMWYHDHAVGITRLNAYIGLASAYIIRDQFESHLRNLGLPDFVENGGAEIPLIIQDKIFVPPDVLEQDPTWEGLRAAGSLWYPHTYDPARWELEPGGAPTEPSVIPEMFGDTMLVNGTVYPEATVEARRYRLRILNACQARFLNLQLYVDDGSADSVTLDPATLTPANDPGPSYLVIGAEGGFLYHPAIVPSNVPFSVQADADGDPIASTIKSSLLTAPAERWDIIVDFKGFAGKKIVLYNDAPAPFPMGDELNDDYPGKPTPPPVAQPGFGPDTRRLMRFNVVPASNADKPLRINPQLSLAAGLPDLLVPWERAPQAHPNVKVRRLTLNESADGLGRLIQMLGTNKETAPDDYGRPYDSPATETPRAGAVEIWEIANLTGDTHPIHFHLVNVQVLSRQPFDAYEHGTPHFSGPARGPEATEIGWKETVKMHPNEVTRVIMKFDLPRAPFAVPPSPRTGGHEYVWHCHILEHEEHDMMRPLVVW